MFENVINDDAIDALTQEELDMLLAMLKNAGY
jgi:hypothetical protein